MKSAMCCMPRAQSHATATRMAVSLLGWPATATDSWRLRRDTPRPAERHHHHG